ncbi:FAD-dependent monooxygenase [Aliiglaciecola sp. 3_MG-2023]|uniref:FAD-dependent oxidoreductase n=1 Tax=Aliiglaciecola sp. 3_MG-2023 TaxID=3062644 RepID=UPI0026E273D0|nr:FAD-dependent oxidoreductase [Aliiglaciecola sp. 3_MG-2023]MDO6694410.1 FAD-dependent monooxygenase [Aliiglaciecola sp. 3_MG-2023]
MFDVGIVGGGMVGAATAVGLAKQGLKVVVFEVKLPSEYSPEQPPDMRVSAINLKAQSLLHSLGVWQDVESKRICPFKRMLVWEEDKGATQFDSSEINQGQLGFIVENRLIQLALLNRIRALPNITLVSGVTIKGIESGRPNIIRTGNNLSYECKMLVGADGGNSQVRNALNIGQQGWQYKQHALAINIKLADAIQQDITWQQFKPSGPVAFLPLYDGFASLVWYDSADRVAELKRLNSSSLKAQILGHFPDKLRDFEILQTASFPLTRMHANQYYKGNSVLIGDAAHTINPLAGQGVNLGFRDVSVFLECLSGWDISENSVQPLLKQYESKRKSSNLLMMSTMDAIYAAFSNDNLPLKLFRNLGLNLADKAGPIKKQVMKVALGLT